MKEKTKKLIKAMLGWGIILLLLLGTQCYAACNAWGNNIICKWEEQRFKEGDVICYNKEGFNRKILCVKETEELYLYLVSTNMNHGEVWKWCTQYELRDYRKARMDKDIQEILHCPSCKRLIFIPEKEKADEEKKRIVFDEPIHKGYCSGCYYNADTFQHECNK